MEKRPDRKPFPRYSKNETRAIQLLIAGIASLASAGIVGYAITAKPERNVEPLRISSTSQPTGTPFAEIAPLQPTEIQNFYRILLSDLIDNVAIPARQARPDLLERLENPENLSMSSINMVICGVDSFESVESRCDIFMVASIEIDGNMVVQSVGRDNYYPPIDAKLTAIGNYSDEDVAIAGEYSSGIPIDMVMRIDMSALEQSINTAFPSGVPAQLNGTEQTATGRDLVGIVTNRDTRDTHERGNASAETISQISLYMFGQFRQNALEEPGKAFTRMERIIRLVEELEQQNHIRLFTFAQESSLSGTNGDGRIVLSELARIYTSKILEKPELLAMMAYADQPKVETPVVDPENYFTAWYHEQQIEFPVEMMDQVQQSLLTGGSLNYLDPAEVFRSSRELFAKILQ